MSDDLNEILHVPEQIDEDIYANLSATEVQSVDEAVKLINEAEAFYQNEEFAEAEGCYLEALPILESIFGMESPRLAVTLAGLAECAADLHKPTLASQYEERGLAIMRAALGGSGWTEQDTFFDLIEKYRELEGLDN